MQSEKRMKPSENSDAAQIFATYPPQIRRQLSALRKLIFEVAKTTEGVGPIEEALKWGEPAYLTSYSKSGSTIRLGWKKSNPAQYAIYFNCQTNLVESFRTLFPSEFKFQGNRAIVFDAADVVPTDALCFCIAAALTYHRDKISGRSKNS
jgi:Domain of unknown function (DU1801)